MLSSTGADCRHVTGVPSSLLLALSTRTRRREKLRRGIDLRSDGSDGTSPRFLDYRGGCDPEAARRYLLGRFLELARRDRMVRAQGCQTPLLRHAQPPKVFTPYPRLPIPDPVHNMRTTLLLSTGVQVYNHVTCATDSANIRLVFKACKDAILRENLRASGLDRLGEWRPAEWGAGTASAGQASSAPRAS